MIEDEFSLLTQVAVRSPEHAYQSSDKIGQQWQPLRYRGAPDFDRACAEHARLRTILVDNGAEVVYLSGPTSLTLDAVYTRDATVVTPKGLVLCQMGRASRQAEPSINARLIEEQTGLGVLGQIEQPGLVEGGDVIWLDARTMAIGRGVRTNDAGIDQLRRLLGASINVHAVTLPEPRHPDDVFHLMMIISPLDRDLALVHAPSIPDDFADLLEARGIRMLQVPEDEYELMACNVLAIGPRHVIMLQGLPKTKALLEQAGCRVQTYVGAEISFPGEGGATCLALPLARRSLP